VAGRQLKQWAIADAVEAALFGDRSEANAQAAALDARPAGGFLLAIVVPTALRRALRSRRDAGFAGAARRVRPPPRPRGRDVSSARTGALAMRTRRNRTVVRASHRQTPSGPRICDPFKPARHASHPTGQSTNDGVTCHSASSALIAALCVLGLTADARCAEQPSKPRGYWSGWAERDGVRSDVAVRVSRRSDELSGTSTGPHSVTCEPISWEPLAR
jgi:hypothetical protein